jgi:hypothetical protein
MVYLYAGMGLMMLTGIMAVVEMGLSLTGGSMLPVPSDIYSSTPSMKQSDMALLEYLFDQQSLMVAVEIDGVVQDVEKVFSELVEEQGLCGALNHIGDEQWTLVSEGYLINGCQLTRGSHRAVVKQNADDEQMPYQLFSCAVGDGNDRCPFENE